MIIKGGSVLFLYFCLGCALQSSLVDLEHEVNTTREAQLEEIQNLVKRLETQAVTVENVPVSDAEGRGLLLGKINQLERQIELLEGRLEEEGHKTAEMTQSMDNQKHQVNALLARFDLIEKNISTSLTTPSGPLPMGRAPTEETSKAETRTDGAEQKKETKKEDTMQSTLPRETKNLSGPRVSPQEAYRLAYNDYLTGKYDLAISSFKNYVAQYPDSIFLPEAIYWIAQSYYNQGQYHEAVLSFQEMEKRYPIHDLIPTAMLKTALSFEALGNTTSAREFFTKVIERFPQTDAALRAKAEISALTRTP